MNRKWFVLLASLCVALVLSSCASVKDIGLEGSGPLVQVSRLEAKALPEVVELPVVALEGEAPPALQVTSPYRVGTNHRLAGGLDFGWI